MPIPWTSFSKMLVGKDLVNKFARFALDLVRVIIISKMSTSLHVWNQCLEYNSTSMGPNLFFEDREGTNVSY